MVTRGRGARAKLHVVTVVAVVLSLSLSACSGDGTNGEASTTVTSDTGEVASTTDPTVDTDVLTEPFPAGVRWEGPEEVFSTRQGVMSSGGSASSAGLRFSPLGDELWVVGRQGPGVMAARLVPGATTWTEVVIGSRNDGESLSIKHLLMRPGGGYLAVAARGTGCQSDGSGVSHPLCTRETPAVFMSDDGETWSESETTGWTPESGSSLQIDSIITVDDEFLAAGTIKGPNWRSVLYSSSDGITWSTEREITVRDHPTTSGDLVHDGEVLVFIAHETPCGVPADGPSGWSLGSFWELHGRIFMGADSASLVLQEPSQHPLAPEYLEPPADCGSVDGTPYAAVPYPGFRARLVNGVATIFEEYVPAAQTAAIEAAEGDDDRVLELRETSGNRTYGELIDGTWVVTDITGVSVPEGPVHLLEFAGTPAFAQLRSGTNRVSSTTSTILTGVEHQSVGHPLVVEAFDIVGFGDELLLLGVEVDDPFANRSSETAANIVIWRSAAGNGVPGLDCEMVAGGTCRFSNLALHPAYPDFTGLDLAWIDLVGTDLGEANFDGADLTGARGWIVQASGASFVDATLDGAQFQGASLGDISGARVGLANFRDARLGAVRGVEFSAAVVSQTRFSDIGGAEFGSTDLTDARLWVVDVQDFPDLSQLNFSEIHIRVEAPKGEVNELDLSGVDLTGVTLSGPILADGSPEYGYLVITSLDGAILSDTSFSEVDLSRVGTGVDLSGARFLNERSVCPDGSAPGGSGFNRTCPG